MKKKNKVIAIVGPTASGKTAYAIELAKELGGEIVSADSRIIYKGFNVACAKPSEKEKDGIPHYMIDIVEPECDYSAGLYAVQAKKCINWILAKGKVPIVVGGTGLYFRVLLENFDLPKVEPNYAYRDKLKDLSKEELYSILCENDIKCAEKIDKNDKKKIIRALEVIFVTGKRMSELQGVKEPEFDVTWYGRNFPRDILYDRINKRVDMMVEDGIVDETKYLIKKHGRIPNIVYTIGYQEVISYLDGEMSLDDAMNKLKQNSRNYAKRQLTWFRKNEAIQWNYYPEKLKK